MHANVLGNGVDVPVQQRTERQRMKPTNDSSFVHSGYIIHKIAIIFGSFKFAPALNYL